MKIVHEKFSSFRTVVESSEDEDNIEEDQSSLPPTIDSQMTPLSPEQLIICSNTTVDDVAARRRSLEHSTRLKQALRFSESPKMIPVSERSTRSLRKDRSLAEEEMLKIESLQLDDEGAEEGLGIEDISICNFSFVSEDEESDGI
jgi:hypothetical protein